MKSHRLCICPPSPGALSLSLAGIPLLSPSASAPTSFPALSKSLGSATYTTTVPSGSASGLPIPLASATPTALPFRLASCLPPIPAKLVKRIQALEFVEMRDLLLDNMALAEKLEALPVRLGQTQKGAEQREVGSLLTWVTSLHTLSGWSTCWPMRG